MKLARWALPVVLRVLSLAGLTSAGGGSVTIGLALSSTPISVQQPQEQSPVNLELNFFLKVADKELKLPVLPITWGVPTNKKPSYTSQRSLEAPPTASPSVKHQRTLTAPENIQKLLEYYPSTDTVSEPISSPQTQSSPTLKRQREEDGEDLSESKQHHPKKKSRIYNTESHSDGVTKGFHQTSQKLVKYVPRKQRLSSPSALLVATSTATALVATKSANKNNNKRKLKTFQYTTEDEADDDMSELEADVDVDGNVGSSEVYASRQAKRRRGNEIKTSRKSRRFSRYKDGEVRKWSSERTASSYRR